MALYRATSVPRDAENVIERVLGMTAPLTRWWPATAIVLFACFTILAALVPLKHPAFNWDMLAYLALAQETPESTPAGLHDLAYDQMREAAPPGKYMTLVGENDYRIRQAADAAAFASMLPMYRIKLLYVKAIGALSRVTDPITAIRLINVAAALAIGGALLWWLGSACALAHAPLVAAFAGLAGYMPMLRLGTPDMASAALILGGVIAFRQRREALTAVALFPAFLTRPDNIVFLALLAGLGLVLRVRALGAVAAFAASLAAYVPLTDYADHAGWWSHVWFGTVEYVPTLDGFEPPFSLAVYLHSLVFGAARAVIEGGWPLLAGLAIGWGVVLARLGVRLARRDMAIILAALLAMAGKFVLFPIYDGRLYFPLSIIPLVVMVTASAPLVSGLWSDTARRP